MTSQESAGPGRPAQLGSSNVRGKGGLRSGCTRRYGPWPSANPGGWVLSSARAVAGDGQAAFRAAIRLPHERHCGLKPVATAAPRIRRVSPTPGPADSGCGLSFSTWSLEGLASASKRNLVGSRCLRPTAGRSSVVGWTLCYSDAVCQPTGSLGKGRSVNRHTPYYYLYSVLTLST